MDEVRRKKMNLPVSTWNPKPSNITTYPIDIRPTKSLPVGDMDVTKKAFRDALKKAKSGRLGPKYKGLLSGTSISRVMREKLR